MTYIPFNRATTTGKEFDYMQQAVDQMHISGDGPFTKKCSALLEDGLGVPKVLLTTSCTHALEMAALLLDTKPGDEVIVPSFTFVSTVNAFVLYGAKPVFADIRPDTLNLDEAQLERLVTPRTKAIIVVHYAGVGCEMEDIHQIAQRHGVADCILEGGRVQEGDDGLRNGSRTGQVDPVVRPDGIDGARQVVAETLVDLGPGGVLVGPAAGQEHGQGGRLRPFDSFRVVVCNVRTALCFVHYLKLILIRPANRVDPHGRAIAEAAIRLH